LEKFEIQEQELAALLQAKGPPYSEADMVMIRGDVSKIVSDLVHASFTSKPLLSRIVRYFQGIIDLSLKFLRKKQNIPVMLLIALLEIFNGHYLKTGLTCRFYLTYGVAFDEPFNNGSFAERQVVRFLFSEKVLELRDPFSKLLSQEKKRKVSTCTKILHICWTSSIDLVKKEVGICFWR
jgi:hypothetical protein